MKETNEFYKEIILSSRHIRNDFFECKWINEYFYEIKQQLNIEKLECLILNSLERKICFSDFQSEELIIFDNYIIELFDCLNYLYTHPEFHRVGITKIFLKICAEIHYLENEYNASLLLCNMYVKLQIPYKLSLQNEECLFCQQAYLFFHELEHYMILKNSKLSNNYVVFDLFTKYVSDQNLANDLKEFMSNKSSMEELACDSQAIAKAVALTKDIYSTNLIELVRFVLMAQFNIFIFSEIERLSKYKIKEREVFDFKEYRIRSLYLGFYLIELMETVYCIEQKDVIKELSEISEFFINSINYICEMQDEEFINLLCYSIESTDSISQKFKDELQYIIFKSI